MDAGTRVDASGGAGGAIADAASPGCGKRGIGSVFAVSSAPVDLAALSAPVPGVSWFYGWSRAPSSQVGTSYVAAGVEWVPMVWGKSDELSDTNLASRIHVGPGTKYLLGYNEPNFTAQSNLTPAQAAAAWPYLEKRADQLGLKTVAPAVNFCGGGCNETDPSCGSTSFSQRARRAASITSHFIRTHATRTGFSTRTCRKPSTSTTRMARRRDRSGHRARLRRRRSGRCWSTAQVDSYMKTIVPWLESQPAIFRYSWFGDTTGRPTGSYVTPSNALLAGPGQLTSLGVTYTTLPAASCP